MSVNFFENACQELPRLDLSFGLCDNQDGSKAYSSTSEEDNWIAAVKNDGSKEVTFTPIDQCIIILRKGTKEREKSCDGMLTFENSLFLMELKDRVTGGWISEAKKQLENTIRQLQKHHDINEIKYKKAFACNKRHPNFTIVDSSEKKAFFERTKGFRIDIQAEIVIK